MPNVALLCSNVAAMGALFSPADLFLGGVTGGWYDPSDLSTMFQDTAGTTPVSADGQSVARINDKSGNGNNLLQGTAGSRPLYKTSGGLHWLEFDGTADFLATSGDIALTDGSGQHSSAACAYFAAVVATQSPIDADDAVSNRFSQLLRINSGNVESLAFNTGGTPFTDVGPAVPATTAKVLSQRTSTSTVEAFSNGASSGGGTAVTPPMQTAVSKLLLGAQGDGTTQRMAGRIYGAVHAGKVFSAGEHAALLTYLGAKAGLSI